MTKKLAEYDLLFEVKDPLGRKIRTTKSYWEKIKNIKHPELKYGVNEAKETLNIPDEIHQSVTDSTIILYARKIGEYGILVVTVKILNGEGFVVTVYQTVEYKPKGELIWQK